MFEQQLGRSVTIDQAATLLHVSRRTIYNRIREGKLQTIRTIGGSQRVLLASLDENRKPVWTEVSEHDSVRRQNQSGS
jgi:excisionase family DNA binding protein